MMILLTMNKIFIVVRDILVWLANISGFSYMAVNIIVYYFVIPFIYFIILDQILGSHYFKISFLIIISVTLLRIRDFELFSDWLFRKSADFLRSFSSIGMNYIVASVVICVFIPLAVLLVLFFTAIQ
tara:strand:- start:105 stop:485 length:381 start_codon:yes stop_codon:yes gene_type:complete